MSSSIVLAGASRVRPPPDDSTIAVAVSCSPGPHTTSTEPPASAVRDLARAAKRSTGQRLSARPAPGSRTTSRSRGFTPALMKNASTRASAAAAARGQLHARGQDPGAPAQRRLAALHDPAQARAWEPRTERRGDRERVDDIAERGELDEHDVHAKRSTIREINSRVEWSFASPTTATSPPTDRTAEASG